MILCPICGFRCYGVDAFLEYVKEGTPVDPFTQCPICGEPNCLQSVDDEDDWKDEDWEDEDDWDEDEWDDDEEDDFYDWEEDEDDWEEDDLDDLDLGGLDAAAVDHIFITEEDDGREDGTTDTRRRGAVDLSELQRPAEIQRQWWRQRVDRPLSLLRRSQVYPENRDG